MLISHRVAVYGDSLALAGVALELGRNPMLEVTCLDFDDATLAKRLRSQPPEILIFDSAQTDMRMIRAGVEECPDLLVIGIEANSDRMLLWLGQSRRSLSMQDLIQVIAACPKAIDSPSSEPAAIERATSVKGRQAE